MKSVGRVPVSFLAVVLVVAATAVCRAGWDITPPADPNRDWGAGLSTGVAYDDNFNGTEFNRQSGFRYASDLTLRAKVPWERAFVGAQYDYGVTYPADNRLGGVDQSHSLNLSGNYSPNPRLLLSISETFVNSLQPQLVQTAAGVPPTVIIAGTYIYDSVGASATYSLRPRWNVSVAGTWDIWSYDEAAFATNNNHQDYSTTVSLNYSIDPRTIVGVNYQYAADTYNHPGPEKGLNSDSSTGYLSLSRQFNPKLALVLNGGYTVRSSEDGSSSTAPSAYGSLTYNYGPLDTISLIAAEALSSASVAITRSFSAQENTSLALQANHRFTTGLHATVSASYVYSTFTAQIIGQTLVPENVTPSDQTITAHCGIGYYFQKWLDLEMRYDYTKLVSSNVNLVQPYDRDQIGVNLILTY